MTLNKKEEQIKNIINPIKAEMEVFEEKFKNAIFEEKNFLSEELYSYLSLGAKRLRVIFVFLFSKILNIPKEKENDVFKIALLCEFLHNATLFHDDILDNEEKRRGQKAFQIEHGNKLSILQGDFLLALALKILSTLPKEIVEIFSKKILNTVKGEISQWDSKNVVLKVENYYKKSFEKTGNIFLAGLESLFCLKEIDDFIKENLKKYLYNFSLAFQIKNDIDDFSKNSSDYKNGNFTLPIIYFKEENKEELGKIDIKKLEKYIKKANLKVEEINKNSLIYLKNIEEKIENKNELEILKDLNNLLIGE